MDKSNTKRKRVEEDLKRAKKQAEKAQAELKKVNKQLKASAERADALTQKAAAADLAKSQFLANMSHEIRTPLNAIIGFSEVLAEQNPTGEQKYYADIIRESSANLLRFINNILDFSKLEAGKLDIHITDCLLGQLLATTESLMRHDAKEKNLKFEVLQCGELPARIRTDPIRLRQCLINLISNAIEFTEEGHVYVNISLQEVDSKPYIRFDVEDTGIGIPPDRQESIFEIFVQTDEAKTCRFGGTGLGLAITKQLANLLDGDLSVTSKVDEGSVFSLIIPAGVDVKSQPPLDRYVFANELSHKLDSLERDKFSGRVLVAEDSRTNRMLINLLLERLGLQVTMTKGGKEAVQAALSQTFDLMFIDIQMPNMNGHDVTRTLRKNGVKTPIVALTAHAMKGDDKKCISAGCSDYLCKPINRRKLLEIIGKYLASEKTAVGDGTQSV